MLVNLSGQVLKFQSDDTGVTSLLKDTVAEVLMLKAGCKVILLFNLNRVLKNGSFGTCFRTREFHTRTLRVIAIENPSYEFFRKIPVVVVFFIAWTRGFVDLDKRKRRKFKCLMSCNHVCNVYSYVSNITLNLSSSLFDFVYRGNIIDESIYAFYYLNPQKSATKKLLHFSVSKGRM